MRQHRAKIFFIVAFILIAAYYLSFTVRLWLENNYIEGLPEEEKQTYLEENQDKLDNLETQSLNLGLDLQGGMHVTLQVGTPQFVQELAGEYADSTLNNIVSVAEQRARANDTDFIDELVREFEKRDENARLSRYFRSETADITRRTSNERVVEYLKEQRDAAVDRAMEIIRTRVNRYGVNEPAIMKKGNNRIVVELPGVDNKERVRGLLKGTARLEFRLMSDPEEVNSSKQQIVEFYNQGQDTASGEQQLQGGPENPLTEVLNMRTRSRYVFGYASGMDTSRVNALLDSSAVQTMLPRNTELLWGAQPVGSGQQNDNLYQLLAVNDEPELTGDVIEEARVNFDQQTNQPRVSMNMNSEGARRWARITGANIGNPIAIVLDNYIYSYPRVETKISNGRSSISGLQDVTEAEDLVNILLSGSLPAPLDIVEERTVGASLGEESIRSGFISVISGLIIVALFMIVYYRKAGSIADLALILNIIFILGILAAFEATLTLPGIAGIVLTIGMAVDANVLIFERIREEKKSGKTIGNALQAGHSRAFLTIFDANLTTLLTALILFQFGTGPVKGFAVTLSVGILASMFTAIFVSRLIFDFFLDVRNVRKISI